MEQIRFFKSPVDRINTARNREIGADNEVDLFDQIDLTCKTRSETDFESPAVIFQISARQI